MIHAETNSAGNMTDSGDGPDNSNTNIDDAVSSVEANLQESDATAVSDNISTILKASVEISSASKEQLSDLEETIENVSDQYNSLSEEEKNKLSQSKELLDHAETAVNAMSESTDTAEKTGSVHIEQTGEENSFRYINGVNINDAVDIVEQEQEEVSSDDSAADTSAPSDNSDSTDSSGITTTSASCLASTADFASLTSTDSGLSGTAAGTIITTGQTASHRGIDVSRHNGTIDWQQVKQSGIEFAIIRCGYGSDYTSQDDQKWAYNIAQCEKYGIPYGVYLYSYATSASQIDSEVQHTLRLLKGHQPALPVYIDIEENEQFALGGTTLSSFAKKFCDEMISAGYKAGLYTSSSKWYQYFGTFAALPNYYHWVAQWSKACTYTQRYEAWQYSSNGTVAGVPTRVDLDLWYGALGRQAKSADSSNKANPNIVNDGTYYIASFSNRKLVLDIASGSKANGANVQLYSLNRTAAQQFTFHYLNNGYYRVTNVNSGKVLDVCEGSIKDGANIQQYNSNNSYAQQWKITTNSDGSFTLTCRASGDVLDIDGGILKNGTNIQQYISNGSTAQKFMLLPAKTASNNTSTTENTGIVKDGTYLIANFSKKNLVLDVAAGSKANGANVQLYSSNGTNAQKFTLKYLNNGYYRITNLNSGKVLDVNAASELNGANVQQYNSNSSYAQQWKITKNRDGSLTFTCRASGKVLDINGGSLKNGTNIQQYTSNGSAAQKFVLLSANTTSTTTSPTKSTGIVQNGTYFIANFSKKNLALDVASGSKANGANVQLYSLNGTNAQKFTLKYLNNGYYCITNVNSGKVLDVNGASMSNGANVQQYNSNSSYAQQWKITKNRDGSLTFTCRASGKVLDINGGSLKNGTNIQQYTSNGSAAQKFVLLNI